MLTAIAGLAGFVAFTEQMQLSGAQTTDLHDYDDLSPADHSIPTGNFLVKYQESSGLNFYSKGEVGIPPLVTKTIELDDGVRIAVVNGDIPHWMLDSEDYLVEPETIVSSLPVASGKFIAEDALQTPVPHRDNYGQRAGEDGQDGVRLDCGASEKVVLINLDTGTTPTHSEFSNAKGGSRVKWVSTTIAGYNGLDGHGHGTHTQSTTGGVKTGICPSVNIYSIQVLSNRGQGSMAGIIEGIVEAANFAKKNPTRKFVINISILGGYSQSLQAAISMGVATDNIVFIIAAGNSAIDGCFNGIALAAERTLAGISVQSMDRDGRLSYYSNYGGCSSGSARGRSVVGAAYIGGFVEYSGTSMAAPNQAGQVLELWERHLHLDNKEIVKLVKQLQVPGYGVCSGKALSPNVIGQSYLAPTPEFITLRDPDKRGASTYRNWVQGLQASEYPGAVNFFQFNLESSGNHAYKMTWASLTGAQISAAYGAQGYSPYQFYSKCSSIAAVQLKFNSFNEFIDTRCNNKNYRARKNNAQVCRQNRQALHTMQLFKDEKFSEMLVEYTSTEPFFINGARFEFIPKDLDTNFTIYNGKFRLHNSIVPGGPYSALNLDVRPGTEVILSKMQVYQNTQSPTLRPTMTPTISPTLISRVILDNFTTKKSHVVRDYTIPEGAWCIDFWAQQPKVKKGGFGLQLGAYDFKVANYPGARGFINKLVLNGVEMHSSRAPANLRANGFSPFNICYEPANPLGRILLLSNNAAEPFCASRSKKCSPYNQRPGNNPILWASAGDFNQALLFANSTLRVSATSPTLVKWRGEAPKTKKHGRLVG